MMPQTIDGPLTPMPSVSTNLGRYVTLRRRQDGTYRVLLEVPGRLRPSGWSAAIPLPLTGARTGDLTNLDEVGRIKADAAALYERLLAARLGRDAPKVERRDLPHLVRVWEGSQHFKAKRPRTQQGYSYHAGLILQWSAYVGHKPVAGLDRGAVETFLALYDDRPTTRRHVTIVLRMLLEFARALEWRGDNPLDGMKTPAPKATVATWERDDAYREAWACMINGQSAVGALILTQWEIGQRLTDARLFRWGAEYQPQDGAFRFWQSKTNAYVTVPVSAALRALLAAIRDPDSPYLFTDRKTGKPFAEQRLGHVFAALRLTKRKLTLRSLRHSCVVQLARAGCTVPEIASITGHSPFSAEQILARYLPRDNEVAWNAQRKRGLIGPTHEQKSDGETDQQSDGQQAAAVTH